MVLTLIRRISRVWSGLVWYGMVWYFWAQGRLWRKLTQTAIFFSVEDVIIKLKPKKGSCWNISLKSSSLKICTGVLFWALICWTIMKMSPHTCHNSIKIRTNFKFSIKISLEIWRGSNETFLANFIKIPVGEIWNFAEGKGTTKSGKDLPQLGFWWNLQETFRLSLWWSSLFVSEICELVKNMLNFLEPLFGASFL